MALSQLWRMMGHPNLQVVVLGYPQNLRQRAHEDVKLPFQEVLGDRIVIKVFKYNFNVFFRESKPLVEVELQIDTRLSDYRVSNL